MRVFDSYTPGGHKLNMSLFWEYNTADFDFIKNRRLVATRVIMLGQLNDWFAAFDLYGGIKGFRKIAKEEVIGLDDKSFNFMCRALDIKEEDTLCYNRKQLRQECLGHYSIFNNQTKSVL